MIKMSDSFEHAISGPRAVPPQNLIQRLLLEIIGGQAKKMVDRRSSYGIGGDASGCDHYDFLPMLTSSDLILCRTKDFPDPAGPV